MSMAELLKNRRNKILRLAATHGAHNVRIFGSAARGEDGPSGDVDFRVELDPGRSLLDLSALWQDLEELLGRRVDVVEPDSVHWYILGKVFQEAVPL